MSTISNTPPAAAIAAINAGVTVVTRRAAIYGSDADTLWKPPNGDTSSRLVGGQISLDYTRDERRRNIRLGRSDVHRGEASGSEERRLGATTTRSHVAF